MTTVVPWTEQYRPMESSEVCGNYLEFDQVLEYGRNRTYCCMVHLELVKACCTCSS